MDAKNLKIPALIIAIGLVLCLVAHLIVGVIPTPTIKEQDFQYSVTYKLNGETKTHQGVYRCKFVGHSDGEDPRDRCYSGEYIVDGQTTLSHTYTIAEKDGAELYIVTTFNDCYLMGDKTDMDYESYLPEPYVEAVDENGYAYEDGKMPSEFDAEIVSWEYPEPIENTFVFSGFSILHIGSMLAMTVVGLLVIVACLIFVKRDKTVPYKVLDKLSILLNFAACFLAIPFATICTVLLQLTVDGDSILYQIYLSIPALTAFTVAASIALRRNGYTKTGFFIQFVGPVLFFVPLVLESIFYNIFG